MSSVNVCFELMDGALTGRPIVFKAFSSDGSAVGMRFNINDNLQTLSESHNNIISGHRSFQI